VRHHDGAGRHRARARRGRGGHRARGRRHARARDVRAPAGLKVLVREPIAEAGIELLRERFDVDVDANGDLTETIGGYDAIVSRSATKLDAAVLEKADRLKVIGRAGVGVDNVEDRKSVVEGEGG